MTQEVKAYPVRPIVKRALLSQLYYCEAVVGIDRIRRLLAYLKEHKTNA